MVAYASCGMGHIELARFNGFAGLESVSKYPELKHIEFMDWVH
jgi:hypothetical protein